MLTSRRLFLGSTAAASLASAASTVATMNQPGQFKLGIATYSFRKFPRDKAIAMTKKLGVDVVSIKDFHLAMKGTSAAERAAAAEEFRTAGISVVSGGVIQIQKEEDLRGQFQYAKDAGFPMMIIMPSAATMPSIEKLVKEFDIKVAIHNHGPEDKNFPSALDALKVIKNMDPRVGLCCDIGHEVRTGSDLLKVIAACGSRLLDVHSKDLKDLKEKGSQVPVGDGNIPIAAMFKLLRKLKYAGNVNLEYEIDADDPMLGMAKSFAHMRGILAAING